LLNQLNQQLDAHGRPRHRARGQAILQEQFVYEELTAMAKLACMQPAKFI
jgi:hypothetical protein